MKTVTEEKKTTIDFLPITPDKRDVLIKYLWENRGYGCEVSFANLCLWGDQKFSVTDGQLIILSRFGDKYIYHYPIGNGNKKEAIDRIISDAKAKGIRPRISGLTSSDIETLDQMYSGRFRFSMSEDSFDYVYDINDLAELKGKKYHGKRNHIARFKEMLPNYRVEPISEANTSNIWDMAEEWYAKRTGDDDYEMERIAIKKALESYSILGLEGLALMDNDRVIGFAVASRMSADTFDVHFEKAYSDIQGAYSVINQELAIYLRSKYPDIKYLDREEDMGIEGLRRAKKSYYPHHMVEKYNAYPEDENEN